MVEAQGQTQPASFGVTFRHTAATTEGQSGSPIWTERGGRLMLIGIATSYDATSQLGLLLHDRARSQSGEAMDGAGRTETEAGAAPDPARSAVSMGLSPGGS